MNTNQSNVSFQSVRVSCSKAKTRLLILAFLLCLSGSAWAQPLPFDLTMPDFLMLFKGSLVAAWKIIRIIPNPNIGQRPPSRARRQSARQSPRPGPR